MHIPFKCRRFACLLPAIFISTHVGASLNIFACEPEWAALASEIGGDQVSVYSATTSAQDPHHIQARPSLISRARRADVLVCSGAGLESGWLPVLLRKSANPAIQLGKPGHFLATDHVDLLDKQVNEPGSLHAAGNPHVHFDPRRMLKIAWALSGTLQLLDPSNSDYYQSGVKRFADQWESAIQRWEQTLTGIRGRAVIVHHDSWRYLLDWAGLLQVAALEPKHGVPPGSRHLAKVARQTETERVDMILRSAYEDSRPSDWLSRQSGVPVVSVPFTVSTYKNSGALQRWMDRVIALLVSVNSNE